MQIIQNSVIRAAYRLNKFTSTKKLHETAKLDTIKTHINKCSLRAMNRMKDINIVRTTIDKYQTVDHIDKHEGPLDILTKELGCELMPSTILLP